MPGASPRFRPEDRSPHHRESGGTPVGADQLDTIQQRLFAVSLAMGLAGSTSTDAATATELRRLEALVAELIVDIRAWARPQSTAGSDGMGTADGDPRGKRDVTRRDEPEAAHGRDRR
jgi:hypothetical protein